MMEPSIILLPHVRVGLEETSEPTRRVITTVSGKNIGYGSTCECLVQAGLVILQEEEKLPNAALAVFTSI